MFRNFIKAVRSAFHSDPMPTWYEYLHDCRED